MEIKKKRNIYWFWFRSVEIWILFSVRIKKQRKKIKQVRKNKHKIQEINKRPKTTKKQKSFTNN